MAKVLCILLHWGVQLILAYSWARPTILVAGKGIGGMFLFLKFLHFHSCSSFIPVPLFHLPYYLFSPFLWKMTQNDLQGLTVSLNPNTINQSPYHTCAKVWTISLHLIALPHLCISMNKLNVLPVDVPKILLDKLQAVEILIKSFILSSLFWVYTVCSGLFISFYTSKLQIKGVIHILSKVLLISTTT